MNKILIEKAINEKCFYRIENTEKSRNKFKAKIRFNSIDVYDLNNYKFSKEMSGSYFSYNLLRINFDYINLNLKEIGHWDVFCFGGIAQIENALGNSYELQSMNGLSLENFYEIYEKLGINKKPFSELNNFLPKIKSNVDAYFFVPKNEEEYYFKLLNGIIVKD